VIILRTELKFVVHHSVRSMMLERLSPHLTKAPHTDRYARSPILSQYFDSPDLVFCDEKDDGLAIRNKVRLRTYATSFQPGAVVFLEIKHRHFNKVRKLRQRIDSFRPELLDPADWDLDDESIEGPFAGLRERHRLRPSAQTYYQREAYECPAVPGLRITFDSDLVGLHPGERLTPTVHADRSRSLMPDTLFILEIKSNDPLPQWLHDEVVTAELSQQTIPKYVSAVDVLGLRELAGLGVYR
jgi:hypothetical protein